MKKLNVESICSKGEKLSLSETLIEAEYLSVKQVANLLGVPQKTVRGWIYKGLLKPLYVGPRILRFSRNYIKQWISDRGDS